MFQTKTWLDGWRNTSMSQILATLGSISPYFEQEYHSVHSQYNAPESNTFQFHLPKLLILIAFILKMDVLIHNSQNQIHELQSTLLILLIVNNARFNYLTLASV